MLFQAHSISTLVKAVLLNAFLRTGFYVSLSTPPFAAVVPRGLGFCLEQLANVPTIRLNPPGHPLLASGANSPDVSPVSASALRFVWKSHATCTTYSPMLLDARTEGMSSLKE